MVMRRDRIIGSGKIGAKVRLFQQMAKSFTTPLFVENFLSDVLVGSRFGRIFKTFFSLF
jgi:hypothetical protein